MDDGDYTLEEAGMENTLKALHGKALNVRKYSLGYDYLFCARFKKTTVVKFTSEAQFLRIYRELGIILSRERFKVEIKKLLGTNALGTLQAMLANGTTVYLKANRDEPGWTESLYTKCDVAGGGVLSISV